MRIVLKFILLSIVVLFSSCKAKLPLVKETLATNKISSDKIIEQIYANKQDFQSVYIRASIAYKDEKQDQNVTAEIKILKNQQILVSVRFLGFTVAKGIITPTEVKYYEKIGGKYFEGNYATLSKWLGTDLDFFKVQNMLLGKPLDDLKIEQYSTSIQENFYKLENVKRNITEKTFYFEAENFLTKKQEIIQSFKGRSLSISYADYKIFENMKLPTIIAIIANDNNALSNIDIAYNSVTFNQDLSFSYSVPDGYEKMTID
jgi:hypothetical protein